MANCGVGRSSISRCRISGVEMSVAFDRVDSVQMKNGEVSPELEAWLRDISDQINTIIEQIETAINTLHP